MAVFDPAAIIKVLARRNVSYVLVGGLAAVLHGSPTMTNDVDIVPATDPLNMERLSLALRDLEARLRAVDEPAGIVFDPHPALLASMAMLCLVTRSGDLDLVFQMPAVGAYDDLVGDAVAYELEGHRVLVARLEDVIRSKEAAGRPKDNAVLPLLRAVQEEAERKPD